MTGAGAIAETLAGLGVQRMYGVSGNQVLALIDAADRVGIELVHMRHETAALYAAGSAAVTTGQLAVALTSAGPGFLAAMQGAAGAAAMEAPVLYLAGASPLSQRGQGAFQEVDQARIAGAVCKGSLEIGRPEEARAVTTQAIRLALAGVPGPVHVALPNDVLGEPIVGEEAVAPPEERPELRPEDRDGLMAIAERLSTARRPAIVVRPAATRGETGALLSEIAQRLGIAPIVADAPRGLGDPRYADLAANLPEADATLLIGTYDYLVRGALGTGGEFCVIDAPGEPEAAGAVRQIRVAPAQALAFLAEHIADTPAREPGWAERWTTAPPPAAPEEDDDLLHPLTVGWAIREAIGPDDIVVFDGGEYGQWVREALRDLPNPMMTTTKIGGIGSGIPMALGAQRERPEARVIAIVGDGSAGYHLSEMETATRLGLPIVVVVGNDARWGAEWHLQRDRYGAGREVATELAEARYDIAAAGFGAAGYDIHYLGDLEAALGRALRTELPVLINVHIRPERSPVTIHH